MALSFWALFDGKKVRRSLDWKPAVIQIFTEYLSITQQRQPLNTGAGASSSATIQECYWNEPEPFSSKTTVKAKIKEITIHMAEWMDTRLWRFIWLAGKSAKCGLLHHLFRYISKIHCLQLISKTQSVSFHRIEIKFHLYPNFLKKIDPAIPLPLDNR